MVSRLDPASPQPLLIVRVHARGHNINLSVESKTAMNVEAAPSHARYIIIVYD